MKSWLIITLIVLALSQPGRAEGVLLNGVAVIVNGRPITFKEVYVSMAADEAYLERMYGNRPELLRQKKKELMEGHIEQLVERRLILDEFSRAGYNTNVLDSVIEVRINKDIRQNYGGNMLTLKKTLQSRGMTYEEHRQRMREKTIIEALSEHFIPRDPVISPSKIEVYYREHQDQFQLPDQVKLRVITLNKQPGDDPESTKKLGREIIGKLDEGAPFDGMAKIYSQDTKATAGGDRGWIDKTVLRSELTEKAFSLKPGHRSDLIETPEACYILLVEEAKTAHVRPLAEIRDEIEITLKGEEKKRLHIKWIERLKQKSHVQYF